MQSLIFNVDHSRYNAGEIAGFPDREARRLCELPTPVVPGAEKVYVCRVATAEDIAEAKAKSAPRPRPPQRIVRVLVTDLGPWNGGEEIRVDAALAERMVNVDKTCGWVQPANPQPPPATMPETEDAEQRSPQRRRKKRGNRGYGSPAKAIPEPGSVETK